MDKKLQEHLDRYYKHRGEVTRCDVGHNLLGQPIFRTVQFEDGSEATFCQNVHGGWFRNERKAPKG